MPAAAAQNTPMKRFPYSRRLLLLSTMIGCCGFPCVLHATDYEAGLGMTLRGKHDDNIRLANTDKTAVSGTIASPSLNLSANRETSSLELNTLVSLSRYNDSGFNSNDINTVGSWKKQFETSNIGLNLVAIHDSTITSEIRDSGRVGNQADRHEHYEVAPEWGYRFTEVDSIKLLGNFSKDNYGNTTYQGYDNLSTHLDWTHVLNDRWRSIARVTYSDYQSDDLTKVVPIYFILNFGGNPIYIPVGSTAQSTSTQSRSAGGLIGFIYQFNERNSLTLLSGASHTVTDYSLTDPDNVCSREDLFSPLCDQPTVRGKSFNFELDWAWVGERNTTTVTISKADRPSSDGNPLDSWQGDASWGYQLSELSHLTSTLSWGRNRVLGGTSNSAISQQSNRDYGDAGISYNRNLSETWLITAGWQWRYQNYKEIDYRAHSHVVSLAVVYQPKSMHWSR